MRTKRRLAAFVALTAAAALGAVGVAHAINANSTVSFNFTKVPGGTIGTTLKQGKINVHTHTNYTAAGTKTKRARLYFDKNFAFNPSAVPKCGTNFTNQTMAQAMTACKTKLVGTGSAQANLSSPGDVKGCVLAFNATDAGSAAGNQPGIILFTRLQVGPGTPPNCAANPATNGGGNTTVILKAPLATNPGSTTPGGALPAAFYKGGKWLDFNNIPQGLPLSDFNVTVGKGSPHTALTGTKANYVRAKCTSRSGLGTPAKKWVMRTLFTYSSGSPTVQVVNSKHGCK
jgi:hypothetical protein